MGCFSGVPKRQIKILVLIICLSFISIDGYSKPRRHTSFETTIINSEMSWSIAGNNNGSNPNILSELSWRNLTDYILTINHSQPFFEDFQIVSSVSLGVVKNGSVTDSDYFGDDRTFEFSRSVSNSQGRISTWHFGLSHHSRIRLPNLADTIYTQNTLGWMSKQIHLTMENGKQILPFRDYIANLNSSYSSTWQGIYVATDNAIRTGRKLVIGIKMSMLFGQYHAQANWNLRSDFQHPVSFEHESNKAKTVKIKLYATFAFTRNLHGNFYTGYFTSDVNQGKDTAFFSDNTKGTTALNQVQYKGELVGTGIIFYY